MFRGSHVGTVRSAQDQPEELATIAGVDKGLLDPPVVGDRLPEQGGVAVAGEHPDHMCARTAPVWIEAVTRRMSSQFRRTRSRSTRPRAVVANGP